jgi:hypothetical protein
MALPSMRNPRLLLPLNARRAAATVVRHYAEQGTRVDRLRTRALGTAVRCGLGEVLLPRLQVPGSHHDSWRAISPTCFGDRASTEYMPVQRGPTASRC